MANRGVNLENLHLSRKHVTTGLRIVFTVAILYLLLNIVGAQALKQALSRTEWTWLIGMYAMTLCFIVINSAMLKQLLEKVGLKISLRRVALANSLSTMYSLILPSDTLAGLVKWADLSAATGDKPRVLSAMVFAKVALALAPLFFGTLALALHNPFSDVPLSAIAGGLCFSVVIGTAAILNPKSGAVFDRVINSLVSFLPDFIRKKLSAVVASLKRFRLLSYVDHLQILLYSVAAFGFGIAGFYCAVRAAGESVAITALLWVSLVLFIARLLPITISNLGVRESIIVYAFAAYGVAPGPALLIGLLMFSNTIFIAIAGALYQSALAMGWLTWSSNDVEA
jgi:uncharacterized membrane protein YbhN (UPF0104 family)